MCQCMSTERQERTGYGSTEEEGKDRATAAVPKLATDCRQCQCDDLPIPTLFSLSFHLSSVLNMTLNCINYAYAS